MKTLKYFYFTLIILFACWINVNAQKIPSWKINELQNFITITDSVLVINFWATFCKPCNEEIPYMQSISEKYKDQKVKLVLVSLDLPEVYPSKIDSFVKEKNYTCQIVWLNETNADLFCPKIDKSWSGSIPSTFFVNKKTGYRKFVESEMKPDEFESELKKAL